MRLVYIAGPFNGDVEHNCRKAEALACEVALLNAHPVVPHSLGRVLFGVQSEEYTYAGTLELMRRCDILLLVPGWENSKGARSEVDEARKLDKPVCHTIAELRLVLGSRS